MAPATEQIVSYFDTRNASGKGDVYFRLVVHDGGTHRADEAPNAIVVKARTVALPVGTIIIHIEQRHEGYGSALARGGRRKTTTHKAGVIVAKGAIDGAPDDVIAWEDHERCPVRHLGRQGLDHVLETKATGAQTVVRESQARAVNRRP